MGKTSLLLVLMLLASAVSATAAPARPQGPCDIYQAAGAPCAAAHSTTRALYAAYRGPLYQVMRQSDGRKQDVGVAAPSATDAGGYADAALQDRFCADTTCWIVKIYDQSPRHNDLVQPPRGNFSGPALGGASNVPLADMAPVTIMGHKVYGVFFEPGMGLRQNDARGTAVDDQAEGQYWVINGRHFNSGCCFDYGNTEIDSRADGDGTMETTYYGVATDWYHGRGNGPWIMTDQEHNLVGCVTPDLVGKLCDTLPSIDWRFVTATAKGAPHRWTTMGGDAQRGDLKVMFDGARVDSTYDPMRKQGGIVLANGGDNSNAAQGTFYEGAMTEAGTFPSDATDAQVQANIVAARYDVQQLALAPAKAADAPPGLQSFAPGTAQDTAVTFVNTTGAPVTDITLALSLPAGWTAKAKDPVHAMNVGPGQSLRAVFTVTSGAKAFNGDMTATASWRESGARRSTRMAQRVRNVLPVRINEFRVSSAVNPSDAFIELFNAGGKSADISGWSLTQHQAQQPVFGPITIAAGTRLAPHGFYVLGLATSGLAVQSRAGDTTLSVRSVTGLTAGQTITIGSGAQAETRKIVSVGTAAGLATTVWQPVPDGPILTIPAGSTNLPVASVAGFSAGQKIALGHGETYPSVARSLEAYEIATVTAVGKPGTQAFLATDAAPGATGIAVTSVADISVGDHIRLDIDSAGHGIETVTVARVGTAATRSALLAGAAPGATAIKFGAVPGTRDVAAFAVGDTLIVGNPANAERVTITAVGAAGANGAGLTFAPALKQSHGFGEDLVAPGTGLQLTAPLKFAHAANLPFAVRGTGISFAPASAFAHSSNEPVLPMGTGIVLDRPLARSHPVDAAVAATGVTDAGYQGPAPSQWFGGPVLAASAGSMVLRDGAGHVADSLNYGLLVDPWASEGYQGVSGFGQAGCRVLSPASAFGGGRQASAQGIDRSAGRFPDGADSDSNCNDFHTQPATSLTAASIAGDITLKVAATADFAPGQSVTIDTGANLDRAIVATVGTAGGTSLASDAAVGAALLRVGSVTGFNAGQRITIGGETAIVLLTASGRGGARLSLAAPLGQAHKAGDIVSGSGLTFAAPLAHAHAGGARILGNAATPGAPNAY